MRDGTGLTYSDSGVNLEAAERTTERIKDLVSGTRDSNTLADVGLFGGLYRVPTDVPNPILVSSADGCGTKLKVAFRANRHDTIGEDLVNHCVDDILVQGARPMFFMDYLATGALDEGTAAAIIEGIARGCERNRCALLGGETAEMPGFYAEGEYDLAGFIVGIVSGDGVLDGSTIEVGDSLVALASNGLHTNGYSLARKIVFERLGLSVEDDFPDTDRSVADVLLDVHRSYLDSLGPEVQSGSIKGLAHITGGGIPGNLPRSLPEGCGAVIDGSTWEVPTVFHVLQEAGGVDLDEMYRVFNMGVGMIAAVPSAEADALVERLASAGETAWVCGEVVEGEGARVA